MESFSDSYINIGGFWNANTMSKENCSDKGF